MIGAIFGDKIVGLVYENLEKILSNEGHRIGKNSDSMYLAMDKHTSNNEDGKSVSQLRVMVYDKSDDMKFIRFLSAKKIKEILT